MVCNPRRRMNDTDTRGRLLPAPVGFWPPLSKVCQFRMRQLGWNQLAVAWIPCFRWKESGPIDVQITDYHGDNGRCGMKGVPTDRAPSHPGEMPPEGFRKPTEISPQKLADAIQVPFQRTSEIVRGRRGVTPSTALRLAVFCGTSLGIWMNLQHRHDLLQAQQNEQEAIAEIRPLHPAHRFVNGE